MISGPTPGDEDARQHYTYDAWNRMAGVYADDAQDPGNPGTQIMTYAYDGLNRLAVSHDNYYYHFYYNQQWQTLEVRKNNPADGDPERQYVWDIRYIDAPVVRFFDGNLDGDYADEDDNVLYYCNDANMNVTALVDASDGSVVERYAYTPYGKAIVLNPDTWAERQNGSVVKNWILFAGYRFDDETGLYLVRNRVYQAELGRWVQRDPAGYVDGHNLTEYGCANNGTDPSGLKWTRIGDWTGKERQTPTDVAYTYAGLACGDSGDTLEQLAKLISGRASDTQYLRVVKASPGTSWWDFRIKGTVDVSRLIEELERRLRQEIVAATCGITANVSWGGGTGNADELIGDYKSLMGALVLGGATAD